MTSNSTRDPLFDYGVNFKSSADRIQGEKKRRLEHAARQLPYNIAFLDDCLRSILPHDLVVIGARSGAGKTELARSIAASNARLGKRVHYFALEAEQDEMERRTKFSVLAGLIRQHHVAFDGQVFNYPDWYRGRFEAYLGDLDQIADEIIAEKYRNLNTYYRGAKFGLDDIRRLILAEQSRTDLIVLDHLHYVDNDDDNENRGIRDIVMMIRNTALDAGTPVILVVHLRKRATNSKALAPSLDDVHGSSEIAKVCTHVIMLEPAFSLPSTNRNHSNTFFTVPKDRGDGAKHLLALCPFDWRTKTYADYYTLGRDRKGDFDPLAHDEVPHWAARHEPLSVPMTPGADS